jgi:hypothetical protein
MGQLREEPLPLQSAALSLTVMVDTRCEAKPVTVLVSPVQRSYYSGAEVI